MRVYASTARKRWRARRLDTLVMAEGDSSGRFVDNSEKVKVMVPAS
jgi:hypothetical protein